MIYTDCERSSTLTATPASIANSASHQHLNILSSHLNSSEYLATATAMALSPKYNTAFTVTNLLNPVLEESYKKQQLHHQLQHHGHHGHHHNHDNFILQSYRSNNSCGNSITPSSSSSSSSSSSNSSVSSTSSMQSIKHPSPSHSSHSLPPHPSLCNYQNSPNSSSFPANSHSIAAPNASNGSNASGLSLPTSANPNPYFSYASNQFTSPLGSSQNQMANNFTSHHPYGLSSAYQSPYCNTIVNSNSTIAGSANESENYANAQLQYSNGSASAWYPTPGDPRFASNYISFERLIQE